MIHGAGMVYEITILITMNDTQGLVSHEDCILR